MVDQIGFTSISATKRLLNKLGYNIKTIRHGRKIRAYLLSREDCVHIPSK